MLSVDHPKSLAQLSSRNALLEGAMREESSAPWPYAAEYPLVLGPGTEQHSYCIFAQNLVVAHANLWPRSLSGPYAPANVKIGLVGNVATDKAHRGRGLMRTLFQELVVMARQQDLSALILWSDLSGFYQRLGFTSCGRERRYLLSRKALEAQSLLPDKAERVAPQAITKDELGILLDARHPTDMTLARDPQEFARQLAIPDTALFHAATPKRPSFGVVGRGSDMRGVMHEWGATSPEALLTVARQAMRELDLEQLLLLTPPDLTTPWESALQRNSALVEEHPMAWVLPLGGEPSVQKAMQKLFVWGLDSI